MRKVYISYNNINSVGYIIKKLNSDCYWVFIDSINSTLEVNKKHILDLDYFFR